MSLYIYYIPIFVSRKKWRVRFIFILFALALLGCGGDDEILLKDPVPVAKFVSATPPGGCLPANGTITVTFDNSPRKVLVDMGTVEVEDNTAIIAGPFHIPTAVTITWADGTQGLNYSNVGCHAPCVHGICPYENISDKISHGHKDLNGITYLASVRFLPNLTKSPKR